VIPLLRRHAVRELDRDASDRIGLPSIVLMENAGRGAFELIRARFAGSLRRVLIVGGPGQNGGDGWVVARLLAAAGHAPRCVLVGDRGRVRGDAAVNLAALAKLGIAVPAAGEGDLGMLEAGLGAATVVVDALFGTGLDRPLTAVPAAVVERINACSAKVVALDLPSGVDADSGAVLGAARGSDSAVGSAAGGVAVDADLTVTFAAHKLGLHQHPGAALAGEVVCVTIGVPAPASAEAGLLEAADLAAAVAPRAADAHKGSSGHVLVIAGAPGHTGAALLSGLGALRAGAGLVTLVSRGARAALDAKVIELMTDELPDDAEPALERALALAEGKGAAVVGPGLGLDEQGRTLARQLALALPLATVLDADALTALGTDVGVLRSASAPRVLTPHPGEAARLLGSTSAAVQADRYAAALALAEQSGQVVVLKGARTIIAAPDGRLRVCPTGTPAMAVAGTGDVLSGVIGALLFGRDPFTAAAAGVYLHGLAGELAAQGDRGLLASELAAALPAAMRRVSVHQRQ
jgi:NAD(P)H-hydrate epimerase